MQLFVMRPCHLVMFIMVVSYSSLSGDAESNVCVSLYMRAHTFNKKKKKIAPVIGVVVIPSDAKRSVRPQPSRPDPLLSPGPSSSTGPKNQCSSTPLGSSPTHSFPFRRSPSRSIGISWFGSSHLLIHKVTDPAKPRIPTPPDLPPRVLSPINGSGRFGKSPFAISKGLSPCLQERRTPNSDPQGSWLPLNREIAIRDFKRK
jgi:hypothetical protein